jgi:hypothetical protein
MGGNGFIVMQASDSLQATDEAAAAAEAHARNSPVLSMRSLIWGTSRRIDL